MANPPLIKINQWMIFQAKDLGFPSLPRVMTGEYPHLGHPDVDFSQRFFGDMATTQV